MNPYMSHVLIFIKRAVSLRRISLIFLMDEQKPVDEWFSKIYYYEISKSFEEEGSFSQIMDVVMKLGLFPLSQKTFKEIISFISKNGINDFEFIILTDNKTSWCLEKTKRSFSIEYATLSLCGGIWTKMFRKILTKESRDKELNIIFKLFNLLNIPNAKFVFHLKKTDEFIFGLYSAERKFVIYLIAREAPGKLPLGIFSELEDTIRELKIREGIYLVSERIIKIN